MFKLLNKLADEIFFNDLIEKKISRFNKAIGTAIWRLILSKQDDYYTKNDFIFEPRGFRTGGER